MVLRMAASSQQNHAACGPSAIRSNPDRSNNRISGSCLPNSRAGFFRPRQPKPAALPRSLFYAGITLLLLLVAGIEPNPGPATKCSVCFYAINDKTQKSLWCHFGGFVHQKCVHPDLKKRKWNKDFICKACKWCVEVPQQRLGHSKPRNHPKSHTSNQANQGSPKFSLLQFNANGIRPKIDNVVHYMESKRVKIAAIQETFLCENPILKVNE